MNRKLWTIVGGAVTALAVIGAVGAVAVQAQSPTPPAAPDGTGLPGGGGFGFRGGPHELSQAELDAAAKVLGMTADNLSAQLKSGKTLEQIATAKGVDIKVLMKAIQSVRPMMLGTTELDAAAKALGMTTEDLSAQLKSGKTLEEIATAKGVDAQTLKEAMQAARPMMLGMTELDAAAKALGMTSADLSAAMKSGKTLSDLATQKGVTLKTVQDAIQAAGDAEFTGQIKQAVKDGKMTQDKANWLLEGLSKGYLNGPDGFGFGLGFGFGQGGGHGPGGVPVSPTATP